MSNTTHAERRRVMAFGAAAAASLVAATGCAAPPTGREPAAPQHFPSAPGLSQAQQAIVPLAALAAVGDIVRLHAALNRGLDGGLSISDAREVLVQLYAYAGFPRSLNALGALMQVANERRQRGKTDAPGRAPSRPALQGDALLAAGTANQTRLSGAPVQGPLFDFAPVANEYLRTHLFGDIFERDNLDWQSREVATVSMLAALPGVESQLQSHIRISMNIAITEAQLQQVARLLAEQVSAESGQRAREAIARHLAGRPAA